MTFDDLYRTEFETIVGLMYALSGSRWAAEDLAQDAFLTAHRRWDEVAGYERPGAWVRRVAINRAVSRLRRRAAEARALTRLAGQRRSLPDPMPEDAEEFWAAVRSLPTRQAQAVALHYLDDLPAAEIGEILGCSAETVRVHLHRGRQTLAQRLGYALNGEEGEA